MSLVIYSEGGPEYVGTIEVVVDRSRYNASHLIIRTHRHDVIKVDVSRTRKYPGPQYGRYYIGEKVIMDAAPVSIPGIIMDKEAGWVVIQAYTGEIYETSIKRIRHMYPKEDKCVDENMELPEDSE